MRTFFTLITVFSFFAIHAQSRFGFDLSIGATAVNLDNLVEKDEVSGTFVNDWDVFSSGVSLYYTYPVSGSIGIGAEFMYQYLYWYQVKVPFGFQVITREYDVDLYRFTPFLQLGNEKAFSLNIGPELNFINGVKAGLLLHGKYELRINDKIQLPVGLRLDLMNNIVLTAPVSFTLGVQFRDKN